MKFEPSVIVFIGVVITVLGALVGGFGALRSSQRQSQRQVELREKADEVAESQRELRKRSDEQVEFQRELRKKSDEIAALNQTIAESQKDLREKADVQAQAQTQLRQKSEEIADLNRLIANAQVELRKRSDEVAELNKQIAFSVTGGDSYCYVLLPDPVANNARIVVIQQGKYPLYDVSIRIVDINKFEEVKRQFPTLTFDNIKLSETLISAGNLSPGQAIIVNDPVRLLNADKLSFNIFIFARSGRFTEQLRLIKVEGVWKTAMRVEKDNNSDENPNAPSTLLKEQIDPDFPRNEDGTVNWN